MLSWEQQLEYILPPRSCINTNNGNGSVEVLYLLILGSNDTI